MSMWEPFTEPTRDAIVLAREEAVRRGSASIDIVDVLRGIARADPAVGPVVRHLDPTPAPAPAADDVALRPGGDAAVLRAQRFAVRGLGVATLPAGWRALPPADHDPAVQPVLAALGGSERA